MIQTANARSGFGLRTWRGASASISLNDTSGSSRAVEKAFAALTENIRHTVGAAEDYRDSRTGDVLDIAALALSSRAKNIGLKNLRRLVDESADRLTYAVSGTRIVSDDRTGILVRLRETSGNLRVPELVARRFLKLVADDLQDALAEVVRLRPTADGESADDYDIAITGGSEPTLEIVRRIVPDYGDRRLVFARARMHIESGDGAATVVTILLTFHGTPAAD